MAHSISPLKRRLVPEYLWSDAKSPGRESSAWAGGSPSTRSSVGVRHSFHGFIVEVVRDRAMQPTGAGPIQKGRRRERERRKRRLLAVANPTHAIKNIAWGTLEIMLERGSREAWMGHPPEGKIPCLGNGVEGRACFPWSQKRDQGHPVSVHFTPWGFGPPARGIGIMSPFLPLPFTLQNLQREIFDKGRQTMIEKK